jgi:lincosamide nucleotidyltransferase A/C/D/E
MLERDVLEVLDILDADGVMHWLDGGWGVDALLGVQTRPHADLDLAVPREHVAQVVAVPTAARLSCIRY